MNSLSSFVFRKSIRQNFVIKTIIMMLISSMFFSAGCEKIKMMKLKKLLGNPQLEVSVITVTPKDTPIVSEFIGQTESSHMVEIRARGQGVLDKQLYEEGSMVKTGQDHVHNRPEALQGQFAGSQWPACPAAGTACDSAGEFEQNTASGRKECRQPEGPR